MYKAMKRVYGQERIKNKVLIEIELKTLEKLEKIKKSVQKTSRRDDRIKAVMVNPFLTIMYKRISFRAWLKTYSKLVCQG
jgi:replicative DNA helicase